MNKPNKFAQVLTVARGADSEPEGKELPVPAVATSPKGERSREIDPAPTVTAESQQGRVGRPKGKRSSGEHEQVTAYVRKETYKAVRMALLAEEKQDFSELVEELLSEWLKVQNSA